jgi:hypothetical protein
LAGVAEDGVCACCADDDAGTIRAAANTSVFKVCIWTSMKGQAIVPKVRIAVQRPCSGPRLWCSEPIPRRREPLRSVS